MMSDRQSPRPVRDRATIQPGQAGDIAAGNWIDRWAPAVARPYLRLMRVDRPIGTWLLLFPCWWAVILAPQDGGWPDPVLMALMAAGAFVMRSAGCVINDLWDRDLDAKVARTAARPLASGAITVRRALVLLGLLLLLGLAVLLSLNRAAIIWGVLSLVPVTLYPLMKRLTDWPQAFLGLTFNWGALLGWAAAAGIVPVPAFFLYAGAVAWTLHYDTVYAHQDKKDDVQIGIRSTALRLGQRTKPALIGFSLASILCWTTTVWLTGIGWPGYVAIITAGVHYAWQIIRVDLDNPSNCLAVFRSNRWIGWILTLGFLTGQVLVQ